MNKHNTPFNVLRHTNPKEVIKRDPISATIAGYVAAQGTVLYAAVLTVSSIAVSMVTSAALQALMPKPPSSNLGVNDSSGLLVNGKSSTAPAQFVYGRVRKGGTVSFVESTGTNNKILHQIIVIAAHEVDEITDLYVNDKKVTMDDEVVTSSPYRRRRTEQYVIQNNTRDPNDVTPNAPVTGNIHMDLFNSITSERYVFKDYLKVYFHLGNQTSATDTFANSSESLATTLHAETSTGSSFVGKGLAYIYCRLKYDKDAYNNGVPQFTVEVRGKKITRTVNGVEQTASYNKSSAWVIRDYLKSTYGFSDDAIDYPSFEAAAAVCDRTDVLSNGKKQFTVNGVISADESHGDVLNKMVTTCGGSLFWGSGSWRLYAGAFVAPTKTLTLDDLRSPLSIDTKVSMRDNFNAVRGTYTDASSGYISTDYPQINSATFLSTDGGNEVLLDLPLPYTTDSLTAQRVAKQVLYRSREQLTLNAEFGMNAFDVEVGDFIKIRNERYGWPEGSEKTFEVINWKLSPNAEEGDMRIALSLKESSSAAFGFSASDERVIEGNNTTLDSFDEVPPIGLSITQEYREVNENVVNVLVVQVTSDAIERLDSVIVKYKQTGAPDFKTVGQSLLVNDGIAAGRFEIVGIDVPQINEQAINYTVSVTGVNSLGFRGDPEVTTFNVTADTTAPSPPSSLNHQLSGGTIFFAWNPVTALDLSHYKIHYSSNNQANYGDSSTLVLVDKVARPATSVSYPALSGKFFVSAVDKTGNESTTAASTIVLPSELPSLGQSITHTESPNFSGSKSNLTVSGGNLFMTTYTNSGSTGTYQFDHNGVGYFDVGTPRTVRLSSTITVTRKHLDAVNGEVNWDDIPNNWDTWPDSWDTWTNETGNYNDFSVTFEVRAGNTVSEMNNASFVTASGEVVGQYIQFRAILANTQSKITPNISALSATVEY